MGRDKIERSCADAIEKERKLDDEEKSALNQAYYIVYYCIAFSSFVFKTSFSYLMFCIALCHAVLYYIVSYCIVLYHIVLIVF